MNTSACTGAAVALVLAASPQFATAATLSAFAGMTITFETPDSSNPVQIYTRQTIVGTDDTDGDGATSGGSTLIASSLTNAPVFTTSNRVDAEASATVTGEASYSVSLVQRFFVTRLLDADREVTITLAPLDGLGGTLLQAFGRADSVGDIGSAYAIITLERTGFEGTLFSQSVFENLAGTQPGDIVNAQSPLLPASPFTLTETIPQREVGEADFVYTLTMLVETFALAEPQQAPPDPGVIPLPPAAPLLALGLGCLALLRRRPRG